MIDSMAFVPQHRCRVFIVASLHHDPRNVLLSGESNCQYGYVNFDRQDLPLGFYWTEGRFALGLQGDAVPTLKAGSTIGIPSPPAILFPSGEVSVPDIRDAERLQGFPANWTRPAEDVARASIRWRLVGNAVTVNVVRWIAKKIIEPMPYDSSKDKRLLNIKDWPKAAWGIKGVRGSSLSSVFPASFRRSDLETFLKYPRNLLSIKATRGFLRRLEAGGLRYPRYFEEKIRNHIRVMEERNGL
jgi:DNA (cytosine-5)-methyltransferase 1